MTEEDRGFEPESSNFTDYEGVIAGSKFQVSEFSGNPELALVFRTNSPKLPEWTERYSLGTTATNGIWTVLDDGARVQAGDNSTKFRDNSNYGRFIVEAVKAASINPSTGRSPDGRQWDGTRQASTWLGTKWLMKEKARSFTNRDTGEKVESKRNFPSAYLGWSEISPGVPGTSVPPQAAAQPYNGASATTDVRPVTDFADSLVELDAQQLSSMISLAKTLPHTKFMDEVMDKLPEVLSNANLMRELSRESGLYSSLRSS